MSSGQERVLHVRADRYLWDVNNLFVRPAKELLEFRALIVNIIDRDLKVRYKRSFLGIIWTVLSPLASMVVLWLVFTHAFKVQIPHYALYLFSGLISWNLFLQSSASGGQSILNNSGLIQKIRLPRVLFPLAACINNLTNFFFSFLALLGVIALSNAPFHWTLVLTPIAVVPLLLFSMGWAMLVSSLTVFFRDLTYLLEIALGALFYATPILYSADVIPEKLQWMLSLNPVAKCIHVLRTVIYSGEIPSLQTFLVALLSGVTMFVIGWMVFQRLQRRFSYAL